MCSNKPIEEPLFLSVSFRNAHFYTDLYHTMSSKTNTSIFSVIYNPVTNITNKQILKLILFSHLLDLSPNVQMTMKTMA